MLRDSAALHLPYRRFVAWKLRAPCWCRGMLNISIDPGHRARPSRGMNPANVSVSHRCDLLLFLWAHTLHSHFHVMCRRAGPILFSSLSWSFVLSGVYIWGLPPSAARRNPQRTLAPGHWPRSKGCGHSSDAWPSAARLIAPALGRYITCLGKRCLEIDLHFNFMDQRFYIKHKDRKGPGVEFLSRGLPFLFEH